MIRYSTKIQLYNLGVLIVLFCIFLIKAIQEQTYVNWVYWPGGFILALGLLSAFVISQQPLHFSKIFSKSFITLILYGILFGCSLMILTDLLVAILERFFRLEEQYRIGDLPSKWVVEWYGILDGIVIFFIYRLFNLYFDQRNYLLKNQKVIVDLKSNVVDSNLKSLKAELNPHFLYNAMNSIAMTVRINENRKAVKMIAHLNELLRVVLNKSDEQFVTLKEEIDLLNKYLDIEMIRFGERVTVNQDIEQNVMDTLVPQLILQPIVENAFKHGMNDDMGNQHVSIKCKELEDKLVMSVFNTTQTQMKMASADLEHAGVGLHNVIQRLRQLYKNRFRFQLEQKTDGIEFKIQIPLAR